jgi:outer membrane protein TolC
MNRSPVFDLHVPARTSRLLIAAAILWLSSESARAQGSAAAQATPLPLSGRSTQGGSVTATQTAVPGATTSVNTVSPTMQVQGALVGSVPGSSKEPFSGLLTLREAVQRGLDYNLGTVNLSHVIKQARSQRTIARSVLLPNLAGDLTATLQQINLAAMGFQFENASPNFTIPTVVGPFHHVDLRARLSQSVFDLTSLNNYRASKETVRASELTGEDARDLVVLAVGGTYLQVIAARARVDSARVQVDTASALFRQTAQRREVGLVAQLDVDRSQIQALTQQQRLTSLQNDLAKQKINLVRMIGLRPTDQYEVIQDMPFFPAPALTIDDGLKQASEGRADLKASEAHLRAAELALSAARAERLPSVSVNADYGTIGKTFSDAERTFSVVGRVRVPLWEGGRAEGHVLQAEAVVAQRRAELDDLAGQVEGEVRKAFLDLQAATTQVTLAQRNAQVTREAMTLTHQRFDAGIANNMEVVQAQELVATAELDFINSIFAHNISKLSLARAMGQAAVRLQDFLQLP